MSDATFSIKEETKIVETVSVNEETKEEIKTEEVVPLTDEEKVIVKVEAVSEEFKVLDLRNRVAEELNWAKEKLNGYNSQAKKANEILTGGGITPLEPMYELSVIK